MTKKLSFKNILLFLCLVPMLLLSLLCLVPQTHDMIVSADYVNSNYTFVGSSINTHATFYKANQADIEGYHFINVNCNFSFNNGLYDARVYGTFFRSESAGSYSFDWSTSDYFGSGIPVVNTGSTFFGVISSGYGIKVLVERSGDISSNITQVRLTTGTYSIYKTQDIYYYDVNGAYVRFGFVCINSDTSWWNNFNFTDRTYFISLVQDGNTYYENGYTNGYNQGLVDGNSQGYQEGYNAGHGVGYADGYNAGRNDGSDYSFNGLIGAVIDAPVSAFTSLLNFELFGINILGLVTGLISVGIIILIVKICMGGR